MDQPFSVEEVVGDMDPGLVPGAVSALREDERDLPLDQCSFILL